MSVVSRGDAGAGGVAFNFEIDPARMSVLKPHVDALFSAYTLLAESWAEDAASDEELDGSVPSEATPESESKPEANPLDEGTAAHSAVGTESDYPLVGDLDRPLRDVVETAWNHGFVTWELAVDLPLQPGLAGLWRASPEETSDALKALLLRRTQSEESRFLMEEVLSYVVFDARHPSADGIHSGFVQLDLEALDTLIDALCPQEPARIDACRLLGNTRDHVREHAASLLDLLGESFQVQLGFSWEREGRRLLISNTLEGLFHLRSGREAPGRWSAVTGVFPIGEPVLERGGFLALVRQSHLQYNLLAALSDLSPDNDVPGGGGGEPGARSEVAAYLSSPEGAAARALLEDTISQLTRWSSEVFVQGERRSDSYLARIWYENPDALRGAPEADALVKVAASAQAQKWLSPWLGSRREASVAWPTDSRALVDVVLDGNPATWSRPGLFTQERSEGPL